MPRRLRSFKERFAKPLMAGALLSSFFGANVASANPSGGTVRAGNVNITNVGGSTLHVEQMTERAIIDWQRFGIGQGDGGPATLCRAAASTSRTVRLDA